MTRSPWSRRWWRRRLYLFTVFTEPPSEVLLPPDRRVTELDPRAHPELVQPRDGMGAETVAWWAAEGCRCFGLWEGNRVVSFRWARTDRLLYRHHHWPLPADAVYLFGAWTEPADRGRRLGAALQRVMVQRLQEEGCREFLSISEHHNRAALRYKSGLASRVHARGLLLEVPGGPSLAWFFGFRHASLGAWPRLSVIPHAQRRRRQLAE